jgi:hypothetical protein
LPVNLREEVAEGQREAGKDSAAVEGVRFGQDGRPF